MDIKDLINKFNYCIIQLLSIEIKIDKKYQTIISLAYLPKPYETVVTMLLIEKMMLIVDEVLTALLETKKLSSRVVRLILDKLL